MLRSTMLLFLAAAVPPGLFATTQGAPIGHAGVPSSNPIDNTVLPAQTCNRCHSSFPLNSAGGSVRIQTSHYKPGQTQTVKVTVSHPEAQKWGFQLTARRADDPARKAGTFSPVNVRVRCSDTPAGRDVTPGGQPCGADNVEFAGHNPDIVFGGANGAKTFEVQWTPDADAASDVVFYAVGNAASNGTGNQGDRIYSDNLRIGPEPALRSCTGTARPVVSAVRNAASGSAEISMNSLISVYGTNLAGTGQRWEASRADTGSGTYPAEQNCVAVEIAGQRAPLFFSTGDQINAQVPTTTTLGQVPVRVIINPGRPNQIASEPMMVTLRNYSPALFTLGGNEAAAFHNADGVVVRTADGRPARPGDVVQFYATGLGWADWGAGTMPDGAARVRDAFTMTIGGTPVAPADILYAGLVPGAISGLYQINVRIPASVPDGDASVVLTFPGASSPAATIAVRR